jgi:ABC-type nitrate/sulfonate/bicarbonate transport system permease component
LQERKKDNILYFLGIPLLIGLWYLVARLLGPNYLPLPTDVFLKFFSTFNSSVRLSSMAGGSKGLKPHVLSTLRMPLIASFIGSASGIGMGLLMGLNEKVRATFEFPIEAARTIPPLVIIPFFIMWFGRGFLAQFSILFIVCFFMLVIHTIDAIKNIHPSYVNFARTLGATRRQVFRTVILPGIVPGLIGGLRVAIAFSWGLMVVVELMGCPSGIGRVLGIASAFRGFDLMFVGIIWIGIFAITSDLFFVFFARYVTRWVPKAI